MNKKQIITGVVVAVLSVLAYVMGPDAVSLVKDAVSTAPVSSVAPVDSE